MDTENREVKTQESGCRRPRRKHLLWIIPASVAVLLAAGWFGLTFAVEHAVKRCFADTSSRLIGYEAEAEISCSLLGQELCISGICVENPPGYSERPALKVDLIRVRVNPLAFLFGRVVHLKKLTVSGVHINAELKRVPLTLDGWLAQLSDPEINLFKLKKNAAPAPVRRARRKKRSGSARPGERQLFRIDELRVENVRATLNNCRIFPERWRTFTLESYVQKDLGRPEPLSADGLAVEIFRRHRDEIAKYLEDRKDQVVAWWKGLFKKKTKKGTAPAQSAAPARPEDEAAKKEKSEARKKMIKTGGRIAAGFAESWLKRKKQEMEEKPSSSDDPEEARKARRDKLLVDLGLRAAEAVREELAEPPATPAPEKKSE